MTSVFITIDYNDYVSEMSNNMPDLKTVPKNWYVVEYELPDTVRQGGDMYEVWDIRTELDRWGNEIYAITLVPNDEIIPEGEHVDYAFETEVNDASWVMGTWKEVKRWKGKKPAPKSSKKGANKMGVIGTQYTKQEQKKHFSNLKSKVIEMIKGYGVKKVFFNHEKETDTLDEVPPITFIFTFIYKNVADCDFYVTVSFNGNVTLVEFSLDLIPLRKDDENAWSSLFDDETNFPQTEAWDYFQSPNNSLQEIGVRLEMYMNNVDKLIKKFGYGG